MDESKLTAFHKENKEYSGKAYQTLPVPTKWEGILGLLANFLPFHKVFQVHIDKLEAIQNVATVASKYVTERAQEYLSNKFIKGASVSWFAWGAMA